MARDFDDAVLRGNDGARNFGQRSNPRHEKHEKMVALPFLGVATSKIALDPPHHFPDTDDGPAHFLGSPVHIQ
jgi:hypothetical protein